MIARQPRLHFSMAIDLHFSMALDMEQVVEGAIGVPLLGEEELQHVFAMPSRSRRSPSPVAVVGFLAHRTDHGRCSPPTPRRAGSLRDATAAQRSAVALQVLQAEIEIQAAGG